MPFEKNPDEIGALWLKTGAKGEYMTGEIGGVKVVCFKNTRAENSEKAPAWRVLKSKPQGERAPAREEAEPVDGSAIPF